MMIRSVLIAVLAMAGAFAVFALYARTGAHRPILIGSWCETGREHGVIHYRRCYEPAGKGVIRITAASLISADRECDAIGGTGWRMRYRCSNGVIEQWWFRLSLNSLTVRVEDRSFADGK